MSLVTLGKNSLQPCTTSRASRQRPRTTCGRWCRSLRTPWTKSGSFGTTASGRSPLECRTKAHKFRRRPTSRRCRPAKTAAPAVGDTAAPGSTGGQQPSMYRLISERDATSISPSAEAIREVDSWACKQQTWHDCAARLAFVLPYNHVAPALRSAPCHEFVCLEFICMPCPCTALCWTVSLPLYCLAAGSFALPCCTACPLPFMVYYALVDLYLLPLIPCSWQCRLCCT